MSAGGVRAGSAYVEIFAKDGKFQQAMASVQAKMQSVSKSMRQFGTQAAMGGAALGAPMVMAMRQFTAFDDVLRATQASAGVTANELKQIRSAAMEVSEAMGIGATQVASGFMELMKAGMSLEQVLGGAGKAAIAFAKVGGMEVAQAAVVMNDAMSVFGVTADHAANSLSAAADASSTDIQGIALAFSQVSAVAGLANQSIDDTAAALAILANNGIKGSDAGTSVKTMLMRLMAPADDAVGALQEIGLTVSSFRDAGGKMLPMVNIIGVLTNAMRGLDQATKDDVFRRIFGQDAIRAAATLTQAGVQGFTAMRESMGEANTVGEKFLIMMDGLAGAVEGLMAGVGRLAIAFGDALAPSIVFVTSVANSAIAWVKDLITDFPILAQLAGGMATGLFTVGVAAVAAAAGISGIGKAISGLSTLMTSLSALTNPVVAAFTLLGAAAAIIGWAYSKTAKAAEELKESTPEDVAAKAAADAKNVLAAVNAEIAAAQGDAGIVGGTDNTAVVVNEPIPEADIMTVEEKYGGKPAVAGELGRSLGTFGDGAGFGVGPELSDPMEETARNTKRMADEMERYGRDGNEDARTFAGSDGSRTGPIQYEQDEKRTRTVQTKRAQEGGTYEHTYDTKTGKWQAKATAADASGAALQPAATAMSAGASAGGSGNAITSSRAATRAPAMSAAAQDGMQFTTEIRNLAGVMTKGFDRVVEAINAHAGLTKAQNTTLEKLMTLNGTFV